MKILTEFQLGGESVHRISGPDMCELLAISPAALSDLKKRGIAVRFGHDAYDLGATVSAYVAHLRGVASARGGEEHVLALTTERARLAKEQADAQALKNAALRGEMVSAQEVSQEWAGVLRQVRARILSVPSRLRAALPQIGPAEVAAIDREIRTALEELAHADD